MRSVSVRLADLNKVTIPIGFVGENLHTQVRIDCVKLFEDYPNAVPGLTVNPPMGDTYPAVVTRDGDYVIWDIEDSDLTVNGNGEIQLSFFVDEVIAKSYIGRIRIEKSLVSTGDVPTPIENWIDEANEKLAEVEQWNNVTAEASTLAPGTSATVEITEENGHNKFEFGIPRGDKGDTGTPGFSPVIVVTDITGGHRVSITDVGGTQTVDIMDGEKGDTGNGIESAVLNQDYTLTLNFTDGTHYTTPSIRGAKGETGDTGNGIASVTLNQDYTLTITYTNGQSTTTASIRGEKGETGATPVISIGTVTTLSPGSDATASMDVTDPEHPVLSFGIPKGEPGEVTESELNAVAEAKADIIHDTASGAIASFPDGANGMPVKRLVVNVDPVQDLHGYDSPWPGGGGKNLWLPEAYTGLDYNKAVGTVVSLSSASGVTFNGNTITFDVGVWGCRNFKTNPLHAGTYHYHFGITSSTSGSFRGTLYVIKNDGTNDVVIFSSTLGSSDGTKEYTINVDEGEYLVLQIASNVSATLTLTNWQIESGSSYTSWTPYSNVCPISGWTGCNVYRTGKNLFSGQYEEFGITMAGNTYSISSASARLAVIPCKPQTVYTIKKQESSRFIICTSAEYPYAGLIITNYYNSSNPSDVQYTFTTNSDAKYICVGVTTSTLKEEPEMQCELGSTASSYSAYVGNTYSITFPNEAGTVYGGTLTVNEDGTGKLVVDTAIKTLTKDDSYGISTGTPTNRITCTFYQNEGAVNGRLIADRLKTGENSTGGYNVNTYVIWGSTAAARCWISVPTTIDSVDKFKAWIESNPVQIAYQIATPIVYDLTELEVIETLKGVNNVWCDTGDVSVTYPADTKLYISKQLSASQRLMELIITANHEESMKATKAYTTGNLMIVGGTLYKATTSIANGATLTVGTNVTATTIASELALLA